MSGFTLLKVHDTSIEVDALGGDVGLEVLDPGGSMRGYIDIRLTPGEAVGLSRALVKAAAEALGTEV